MAKMKAGAIALGVVTLGASIGLALVLARQINEWLKRRGF